MTISPHTFERTPITNRSYRLRAVIADDHADMRTRITRLLESQFDIVAAVGDGRSALQAVESLDPDLVILDISMPEMNGIDVARELSRRKHRAKVIFVTLHDSPEVMTAAMAAGGLAFLSKSGLDRNLIRTARAILEQSAEKP